MIIMIMMVIIVIIVIIVASTNKFFFDFDVILSFLTSPKIAVAESDCDHFDRHD